MISSVGRRCLQSWRGRVVGARGWVLGKVATRRMGLVTRGWERKKFYKRVTVGLTEGGEGYQVRLDHRNLRTPLRKLFVVPSYLLALAVAQEWEAQETFVQPALMHLTGLCNTVIDDPQRKTRKETIEDLLQYLTSDTVCYHASEPEDLVQLQQREWTPVIEWFNSRFSTSIQPTHTLFPPVIDPASLGPVRRYLEELNQWAATGFVHCVESCKSLILSCALFEGRLTSNQVCDLALLETSHQTDRWGTVEWQHSVQAEDLRASVAATVLVAGLVKSSHEQ